MSTRPIPQTVGVSGAAQILRISESSVRLFADEGKIPHTRDHNGSRVFRVSDLSAVSAERLVRMTRKKAERCHS